LNRILVNEVGRNKQSGVPSRVGPGYLLIPPKDPLNHVPIKGFGSDLKHPVRGLREKQISFCAAKYFLLAKSDTQNRVYALARVASHAAILLAACKMDLLSKLRVQGVDGNLFVAVNPRSQCSGSLASSAWTCRSWDILSHSQNHILYQGYLCNCLAPTPGRRELFLGGLPCLQGYGLGMDRM
jgi:hypothetical protein